MKKLLKKKKELLKKIKTNILDEESIKKLNNLGFSIKFDNDYNMYLFDNTNNKRMYTNSLNFYGIPYKISENDFYILEFAIINKQIKNISLYEKGKNKKLTIKK